MTKQHLRIKYACYTTNIALALVSTLSPLLFVTFNQLYGISYGLLGLLVLINFCTQLIVDLIFTVFSNRLDLEKIVKITPLITMFGLLAYAGLPALFPNHVYAGLVVGTLLFSASGGLAEVLLTPVIAALPSEHPDREMTKLHSLYAWGVVLVILVSTLFFTFFSTSAWQLLVALFLSLPLAATLMYAGCQLPEMDHPEKITGITPLLKNKWMWFSVFAIFLGASAECSMAQWSSSFMEQALGVSKTVGDLLGVALFALMLGLGRTLYGRYGKNIFPILLLGAAGSTVCYVVVAFSGNAVVSLIACGLTGLFTSMLWPGNLILVTNNFPKAGVALFALMAAGGDLGASVGPQLIGVITDAAIQNQTLLSLADQWAMTGEQFGLRLGILVTALFPLVATILYLFMAKRVARADNF